MKEMVDPSGFVQAILVASTTLLAITSAFMVYLASSKQPIRGKAKNIRRLMLLCLITTAVGGVFAIVFSLTWFFTPPDSILSVSQLWAIWILFAVQFGGFIGTAISFLFYARLI